MFIAGFFFATLSNMSKRVATGVLHRVSKDLRAALLSAEKVRTTWNDLTPLARNEFICWTISVKQGKTRAEHVARVKQDLLHGKRRPCCWPGCPHR